MVLLFNVYLTDVPANVLTPWGVDRGNLPQRSKLDIVKYALSSLAVAYPWKRVIINIELDPNRYQTEENNLLKNYIENEFKSTDILFSSKRATSQQEWKEIYNKINDDYIFYLGNHDHIFMDSSNSYLQELINTAKESYINPTITTSHFPENIRWAKSGYIELNEMQPRKLNENYNIKQNHLLYKGICIDSLNIITKDLFFNWFFSKDWGFFLLRG